MLYWTIWDREPGVRAFSLRRYGSKLLYQIVYHYRTVSSLFTNNVRTSLHLQYCTVLCCLFVLWRHDAGFLYLPMRWLCLVPWQNMLWINNRPIYYSVLFRDFTIRWSSTCTVSVNSLTSTLCMGRYEGMLSQLKGCTGNDFPTGIRQQPSRRMFISLDRRMRETGSLQRSNEGAGNMRSTRTPDFEEEVLARVAADPTTSARRISRAIDASHSIV